MTSFSTRAESARGEWWEIQHSYPGSQGVVYEGWSATDLGQFGDEAVKLLRAAAEAKLFKGFISQGRFRSEKDAATYLIEFARVAVCHKSMSFRVARVVASISVEVAFEVVPPKVCGEFARDRGYVLPEVARARRRARPEEEGEGRRLRSLRRAIRNDKLRELYDRAVRMGWTAEFNGEGHLRLVSPRGRRFTISATSSGSARSVQNTVANARKAGLDI